MIKKKIFIATAVFASICMLGGCATSKSSKKAAGGNYRSRAAGEGYTSEA